MISLFIGIFKEFFSARARAREANEKFEIKKADFLKWVDSSLIQFREQTRDDNREVGDVQDRVDEEMRK